MNRSGLSLIEERVRRHLEHYFPQTGSPVFVIGVSGGPDSMALLHIFKQLEVEAVVAHVNYQKRGSESDKDQQLVEETAREWNYRCHRQQLDARGAGESNFQQWARDQRYQFFRDLQHEHNADAIAVAHHQDDQVETVLQKLFRGAGLESWSAMSVWDPPLFRPLVDSSRREIMNYVETHGVPWRTDRSNLESEFARNLLRNEWLDKLDEFFPGWKQNVLRLPERAALFSQALRYIAGRLTDNRNRIDMVAFRNLEPGLQKALVLHLLKQSDPGIEITSGALRQVEKLSDLQTGKSIQLTEHYSLLNDREWLKIVYEQSESLNLIELDEETLRQQPFIFDDLVFAIEPFVDPSFETALYLDLQKLHWPLVLRSWKAGDAFQPFGMVGHQKISDHLTNRKISAAEKGKALVLKTFEDTICAVIFPPIEKMNPPGTISELVKCEEDTAECLVIRWKQ
ncbi:tRNA lysidine(34) synthetase TilS [Halalkalibaculum sp. DA3122]|uniref:tRNA lysidine(34) synthetase TilS n=1 Tax=unclassified Halalkalibaculum TaxID=2964617 RepID=UPI003753EC63